MCGGGGVLVFLFILFTFMSSVILNVKKYFFTRLKLLEIKLQAYALVVNVNKVYSLRIAL